MEQKNKKRILKRILQGLWMAGALLLASAGLGVLSLFFATHTFKTKMLLSYFSNFQIAVLNILPVLLLMTALYFLFRRLWLSYMVTAVIVMTLSFINYFKLQARDEPFYAEDLFLVSEAGDMAYKYDIKFNFQIIAAVVIILITAFITYYIAGVVIRSAALSISGLAVTVLLSVVFFTQCIFNTSFYNSVTNSKYINKWSDAQIFISKGFIYPFLNSMSSALPKKPDGYSVKNAEAIMEDYKDSDIPEDKKVNIICVMLEAFNDFSKFESIEWSEDPYDIYKRIEEESIHGKVITNIFSGGTINTERCFLTGFADFGSLRRKTPSYVSYLNSQGYIVEGAHPSYEWFYNRKNINENLGFENYYFLENRYEKLTGGPVVAMDNIFIDDLYVLYKESTDRSKEPYFSFSVTYQNHGPYEKYLTSNSRYYLSDKYNDEDEFIADNYFSGIRDTSAEIENLLDRLREDDKPVVVMMFGDHNPWLGSENSVYKELGINMDRDTDEGFRNYYDTNYFIWANDKAKQVLDNDFKGRGPDVGPYFLMNVLFNECGWQGNSYMKFTDDVMSATPLIHNKGLYMQDGKITDNLSDENSLMVDKFEIVQYYMKYDADVR
ncbi:MAG: LTA synthase family protein [Firmicutes bacterium]|nr:LTA synthase family protein [Bacillota bacterium]